MSVKSKVVARSQPDSQHFELDNVLSLNTEGARQRSVAEILLRAAQRIGGELALSARAERLLDVVDELLGVDTVALALLNDATSELEIVAGRGSFGVLADDCSAHEGLLLTVLRSARALKLTDVRADSRFADCDIALGTAARAWIGAPLVTLTGAVGVVFAASPDVSAFSRDDEINLMSLAHAVAGQFYDALRLKSARSHADELERREMLHRDAVEAVADVLWEQDENFRFNWISSIGTGSVTNKPIWQLGRTLEEAGVHLTAGEGWSLTDELQAHRPFRDFRIYVPGANGALDTFSLSGKPVFNGQGRFSGYRGVATDVTVHPSRGVSESVESTRADHAQLTAAVTLLERQLSACADLESLAAAGGDLSRLFDATTMILADVLHADAAHLLRLSPDGEALILEAGVGIDERRIGKVLFRDVKATLMALPMRATTPVVISAVDTTEVGSLFSSFLSEIKAECGVVAPVIVSGRPYGLLGVHLQRTREFSVADLQLIGSAAHLIGSAVERRNLEYFTEASIEHAPELVTRLDADLRCDYANVAFALETGIESEALVGQYLGELGVVPAQQVESWRVAIRAVLRSGRERQCDLHLTTSRGLRSHRVRFIPDISTGVTPISVLVVAHDVAELESARDECTALRQELVEQEKRHQQMVAELFVEQREQAHRDEDAAAIAGQLTRREVEILAMLTSGLTNQQIGSRLNLSTGTVRNHLGRLFPKLDVVDRTQAAVRAIELGLVQVGV
jgi:DNA-binding CsgD family transcriptional regulator/GAF domain-containing protein